MNNINAMAQQQQAPRQPQYFQHPPSAAAAANGMSPPPYPPSPSPSLHYPAPQQYPWPQYSQPPAAKRARLSPGLQSPYPSPLMQSPGAASPANGVSANNFTPGPPPPGSMGPPLRPADRPQDDRNFDDILAGTGINIEEEDRKLTTADFLSHPTPGSTFQSLQPSFGPFASGSQDGPGASGHRDSPIGYGPNDPMNIPQFTPEELERHREAQADWQAGKIAQHPLWDPFLYGDTLHKKISKQSYNEHLKVPADGILRPSQNLPVQAARVNGPDGATRVIDKGQAILQLGSGDTIRDLLNVICL